MKNESFTADEAARIIIDGAGNHFDPALIEIFNKLKGDFSAISKEYAD